MFVLLLQSILWTLLTNFSHSQRAPPLGGIHNIPSQPEGTGLLLSFPGPHEQHGHLDEDFHQLHHLPDHDGQVFSNEFEVHQRPSSPLPKSKKVSMTKVGSSFSMPNLEEELNRQNAGPLKETSSPTKQASEKQKTNALNFPGLRADNSNADNLAANLRKDVNEDLKDQNIIEFDSSPEKPGDPIFFGEGVNNQNEGTAELSETPDLLQKVENTNVNCLEDSMIVTFKFTVPFSGVIYPYNRFADCLLFTGSHHRSATIKLDRFTCRSSGEVSLPSHPEFEHHLMVQWEPDFVSEVDSSVIVRCERPDSFNKTISWGVAASDESATVARSSHPGPQMWMAIQRGEGPTAPVLDGGPVFVGDTLSIVFTLTDRVFWFDSNILSCYAFDGEKDKRAVLWSGGDGSPPRHSYTGQMLVVERGCSSKPSLFSHFYKRRDTGTEGTKTSLHYAHFKAFRFPTSNKIVIECDVEVCYKGCAQLPSCSVGFDPRAPNASKNRARRAADDDGDVAHDLDRANFRRSIEVRMKRSAALDEDDAVPPVTTEVGSTGGGLQCYPPLVYIGSVATLCTVIILLLAMLFCSCRKKQPNTVFYNQRTDRR